MKMTTLDRWESGNHSHTKRPCKIYEMKLYIDDQKYTLINAINQTNYKLQQCGWYYPHMTRDMAKQFLQKKAIGCFLLRQSSDSVRNYTISVKTAAGVVSIRIVTSVTDDGVSFRLDCSKKLTDHVVEENCVIDLVQQLVETKALTSYRFSDNKGHKNIPCFCTLLSLGCVTDVTSLYHSSSSQLCWIPPAMVILDAPKQEATRLLLKQLIVFAHPTGRNQFFL